MEKELIEALEGFLNKKQEILNHIDFCREGLSEEYLHLFEEAERIVKKAK